MSPKRNLQDLPGAADFYETERLILRPMSPEDAGFILDLYNRPKFIQFIGDRNLKRWPMPKTISETAFFRSLKNWATETMW